MIVQGIGDANLAAALRTLRVQYPKHVRFVEEFDPTVAQQIYGGADAFLMPSLFEPCGLGQMIAMRYGTVPIVRRTGGLADTVFEGTNGFTFDDPTSENLIAAVSRAKKAFSSADRWRKLSVAGMRSDFSWRKSALDYVRLYEAAIGARRDARKTA